MLTEKEQKIIKKAVHRMLQTAKVHGAFVGAGGNFQTPSPVRAEIQQQKLKFADLLKELG